MDILSKLRDGLKKTRAQIAAIVDDRGLGDGFYNTMEEALIAADVGVEYSSGLIARVKQEVARRGSASPEQAWDFLRETMTADLGVVKTPDDFPPKPWVVLVVGVNGVGKTTTIGKLCHQFRQEGKNVILGAADTFRAAAIEQLQVWADRTGAGFVAQHPGADPASVAFDALQAAQSRGADVLILDTAGRLHNKANLMTELDKIVRVVRRRAPHAPNETLLVIDATTGQNAVKQAEAFHKALGLTGLVITKLDGTAKGGIAVALTTRLGVPIRNIGIGEDVGDLQPFDPRSYVDAMLGSPALSPPRSS